MHEREEERQERRRARDATHGPEHSQLGPNPTVRRDRILLVSEDQLLRDEHGYHHEDAQDEAELAEEERANPRGAVEV
jgi:hypothetical protein